MHLHIVTQKASRKTSVALGGPMTTNWAMNDTYEGYCPACGVRMTIETDYWDDYNHQ